METIIYRFYIYYLYIDFQKLIGGLISMISGFPLNNFCVNYEKIGFLEIGGRSIKKAALMYQNIVLKATNPCLKT